MIRYRTGIDRNTGKPLSGFDHVRQSMAVILTTQLEERVMRLDFGADLVRQIGRNMGRGVLLDLFRAAIVAIHRHEPEFRVKRILLIGLERTGGAAFQLLGLYYPEGRFGNYKLSESREAVVAIASGEAIGASR